MSRSLLERHYRPRINSRDKGHIILDWEGEEAHLGRFAVVVSELELAGKSVLDVGCGIGDFYRYLQERSISPSRYTGIDILPEMVQEARSRSPEAHFIHGDMFAETLFADKSFDVVFSSGIFNLNMGNNRDFIIHALSRFFSISRQWVVFNLLDPRHYVQNERYFYLDPNDAEQIITEFTESWYIIRDKVPFDYTVFAQVP